MTSLAYASPERTLENLFQQIAAEPSRHARFLNTISMLEYIGARKIMKSQRAEEFDMELLTHVSEETKHAWLVKRLAQQIHKESVETYAHEHLLCGKQAEAYIQDLDDAAEKALENATDPSNGSSLGWLNYLYTSLLIEERADVFYAAYLGVLEEMGMPSVLKAIIKDETKHLAQMAQLIRKVDPDADERLSMLREVEIAGFTRWENALWDSLQD